MPGGGFQSNAFQSNALQTLSAVAASAFQSNAFQSSAFQIKSGGVVELPVVGQGDGSGSITGWERFKDVKPRKYVPREVQEIIIELAVKGTTSPITDLKAKLALSNIEYEKVYGEYIKSALKAAIKQRQDDEDEILMLLEMF